MENNVINLNKYKEDKLKVQYERKKYDKIYYYKIISKCLLELKQCGLWDDDDLKLAIKYFVRSIKNNG